MSNDYYNVNPIGKISNNVSSLIFIIVYFFSLKLNILIHDILRDSVLHLLPGNA